MKYIDFKKDNNIAIITLDRVEKFNSFCREMALNFQSVLDDCAKDDIIKCVVITAKGKAFCAGQDLAEAIENNGLELKQIVKEHYNPIILKIRNLKKPVLCGVNGVAAGAGASLALACDITIAKESASFIQAFSKIGLVPDSGSTFFLPRYVGIQKTMAMMIFAENVKAKEAENIGMIYKSIEDDLFENELKTLAHKMSKMPTKAIWLTKKLLNESFENNLEKQLKRELEEQIEAGKTEDFVEGVKSFLEKRESKFKGK